MYHIGPIQSVKLFGQPFEHNQCSFYIATRKKYTLGFLNSSLFGTYRKNNNIINQYIFIEWYRFVLKTLMK